MAPTPEGGLQFEWHEGGWDVEIEVEPDGTVETWGRHLHNGATFDGAFANTADNRSCRPERHHPPPSGWHGG